MNQFGLHEDQVRFIAGEVVEGLSSLHRLGFVYRDLKPQNIMLHVDGHIRIGDFGTSKRGEIHPMNGTVRLRTTSYVGTIEYMAPEVVAGEAQSSVIDSWGLGVLVYELLVGVPPFLPEVADVEHCVLFRDILSPEVSVDFGHLEKRSPCAASLCRALLVRDARRRLRLSEARKHPFLADVDWGTIHNGSGFHKLCNRLHMHRDTSLRPTVTATADVTSVDSKTSNIFLSGQRQPSSSASARVSRRARTNPRINTGSMGVSGSKTPPTQRFSARSSAVLRPLPFRRNTSDPLTGVSTSSPFGSRISRMVSWIGRLQQCAKGAQPSSVEYQGLTYDGLPQGQLLHEPGLGDDQNQVDPFGQCCARQAADDAAVPPFLLQSSFAGFDWKHEL
mmetsp:Transcript_17451/g.49897  ORF Transcript_17451/g.49897 Transcript_17451/m.49897 type:complete len:390 (-) Transcript_17451:276-1445(-)